MITDSIEFDGTKFRVADVSDVDGKYFISVLDTIRYLGFDIGTSEYARINNRKVTGFEYLQTKFEDSKRKTNIISVDNMREYIFDMQTRDIINSPAELSVKLNKLISEFSNICTVIRKRFEFKKTSDPTLIAKEEEDKRRLEKKLNEIHGTESTQENHEEDIEEDIEEDTEEEDDNQQEIVELEEDTDLVLAEINVRNTKIDAAKFLIIYKQLDSYGKRHLFELLEESDREVIHCILDEEYFESGENKMGMKFPHRN